MTFNKFKLEVASELGIHDYDKIDKGALPSRVNGAIGGHMVAKMIESAKPNFSDTAGIPQKLRRAR